MRTILVVLALLILTPVLGGIVIVAGLLGVPWKPGGVYERMAHLWAGGICRAAGMKLVVHHPERISHESSRIYVSNHVSWFEVFALASILPRFTFVAKNELSRLPLFGRAAKAFGIIFIERSNRKAAFDAYESSAAEVRGGRSVVIFPEGTRGYDYHLRPFKKGPFVFAIAAGVPIVPTICYGTIEMMRKGSPWVRAGEVHIHFLEEVETAGYDYEHRDELMRAVWDRMADAFEALYGVGTKEQPIATQENTPKIPSSFL